MTRNRIFTDGLLSYIKRPGGTYRSGDALRPIRTGCAIRTRIALRSGRTHGTGRSRRTGRSGRACRTGCPGRTRCSSRTSGTGAAGRTRGRAGRRTGRRAVGRLTPTGEVGYHLALSAPLPLRGIIMIHSKFLFPQDCGYATVHPMLQREKCPGCLARKGGMWYSLYRNENG